MEEQPRKLEHVIKVSHVCLNRDQPHLDSKSEKYLEQVTVDWVWFQLSELNVLSGSGVGQQWEHSAPDPGLWRSYRPPSHPRGEMLSAGQRSVIFTTFIVDFRSWVDSISVHANIAILWELNTKWGNKSYDLLILAHKELAQTSYFMATNSLHLTTMCLRWDNPCPLLVYTGDSYHCLQVSPHHRGLCLYPLGL